MKNLSFTLALIVGISIAFSLGFFYGRNTYTRPMPDEVEQILKSHDFYKKRSYEVSKNCDTLLRRMVKLFDEEKIVVGGRVSDDPVKNLFHRSFVQLQTCSALLADYRHIYANDSVFITNKLLLNK